MKQSVSPVVIGVVVVVVVGLACFFGFKMLSPSVNTKTVSKQDYTAKMNEMYGKQQQGMNAAANRRPGGPGGQNPSGMGSGGGMGGGAMGGGPMGGSMGSGGR
jgi:hypothetical protein